MYPFGTKKIMQSHGRKNHGTFLHATSWDTTILQPLKKKNTTQPFGTTKCIILRQKKLCNLSGQKNHISSWDKKKSQNLLDQKILQLSGQKKLRNLLGTKKNHKTSWDNKNHATSQDKKVTQPIGTKKSRNFS